MMIINLPMKTLTNRTMTVMSTSPAEIFVIVEYIQTIVGPLMTICPTVSPGSFLRTVTTLILCPLIIFFPRS